jgi:hypothetical protein
LKTGIAAKSVVSVAFSLASISDGNKYNAESMTHFVVDSKGILISERILYDVTMFVQKTFVINKTFSTGAPLA